MNPFFLAKAAGRIDDWLKGLKDNVVLGGMMPVGTGFKGLVHRSRQHNNIPLEIKKKNLFEGEKMIMLALAPCSSDSFSALTAQGPAERTSCALAHELDLNQYLSLISNNGNFELLSLQRKNFRVHELRVDLSPVSIKALLNWYQYLY